ncbi:MAG: tRNA uridine-5-carboxymethylaminomethyl(34) synthesis GTPase MnmE [Gammaproteobacteria bacterium]|nr:MAG: tRNA uridine-5-carboxymethylaminomethyl(34) synthesis GTPase MnmE [Gammaproteobacteria bacterium]
MTSTDTIAAIATPAGRGGIGVIRVSGPAASSLCEQVTGKSIPPRKAHYGHFFSSDGCIIDTGITLFFNSPNSFTGEDVVEFQAHGGPVVLDMLMERILKEDHVRSARPGEFTERAFLNNKIDLLQAEAIADLIESSSRQSARAAIHSLQGDFSKRIHELKEKLVVLRCFVEGAIDFPDEEIDFLSDDRIQNQLVDLISKLDNILEQAEQGALLRNGIRMAIVGQPNVGKSSLLNALAQREVAIVTEIAGTTRDLISEQISIKGVPVHIIDTAGIRQTEDIVEKKGIELAWKSINHADIIVFLIDSQKGYTNQDEWISTRLPKDIPCIRVYNKIDLIGQPSASSQSEVWLSIKTREGLDDFIGVLVRILGIHDQGEDVFIARRRHLDALQQARVAISAGYQQLQDTRSGELLAEELRQAQQALGQITGDYTTEDLLGDIFSRFCIGK